MVLVQKCPLFQLFFLGRIGQENVFHDILEQKNAFLAYKNKKWKSRKINIFSKGFSKGVFQSWFWSKNGHFSNFFFGNRGQENVFYNIVEQKNAFLGY